MNLLELFSNIILTEEADMLGNGYGFPPSGSGGPPSREADFDEFEAVELYCTKCKRLVAVKKSLLLVLPEGDKYEYRCENCGTPVGDKLDKRPNNVGLITP